jgi:hypothetical protein
MLATIGGTVPAFAQVRAEGVLIGQAMVGDTVMTRGSVVLHHLSMDGEEEVDSTAIARDGSFRLHLPNIPDPARQDVFFASIRHDGVLYFGNPVTVAVQLDTTYVIQAFDTLMAPEGGFPLVLQQRNIFLEPEGELWRVTDLFQILNPGTRTVVTREPGIVWRHPLPEGASGFTLGQSEVSPDATTFAEGDLVLRAPVSPGERLIVVRYTLDTPYVTFPTPIETGQFELLIREPAPLMDVGELTFVENTELEPGTTYRRFNTSGLQAPSVALVAVDPPFEPPIEWAALLLALFLGAVGVFAVRRGADADATAGGPRLEGRRDLLIAVAQLDAAFDNSAESSKAELAQYRRRRAELLERVREAG